MSSYRGVRDHKFFGCFHLLSNDFLFFEIIVFKNLNQFFNFAVFLSFLIVTKLF